WQLRLRLSRRLLHRNPRPPTRHSPLLRRKLRQSRCRWSR
ncbi:MAG: hypothetical protein QOE82_14, partial [Thermoanaerobaculia bacterium]|nr:hypothetical protein [Thermoanaerobaculia bacterium]